MAEREKWPQCPGLPGFTDVCGGSQRASREWVGLSGCAAVAVASCKVIARLGADDTAAFDPDFRSGGFAMFENATANGLLVAGAFSLMLLARLGRSADWSFGPAKVLLSHRGPRRAPSSTVMPEDFSETWSRPLSGERF